MRNKASAYAAYFYLLVASKGIDEKYCWNADFGSAYCADPMRHLVWQESTWILTSVNAYIPISFKHFFLEVGNMTRNALVKICAFWSSIVHLQMFRPMIRIDSISSRIIDDFLALYRRSFP
jgi:hypothetical protein